MDWKPKSEEEIAREGLMQPGVYPAELLEIEERDDKKGRPFFSLTLGIYGDDREGKVWDNISPHWMEFKFRHFFASLGKLELYEKGTMPAGDLSDLLHAPLTVEIGIRDAEGAYPAKNVVLDYVQGEVAAAIKRLPEVKAEAEKDSGLPF